MSSALVVFENEWLIAAPSNELDIPGYLIATAKYPYEDLYRAPPEFQTQLGVVLARLEKAIAHVTGAERVYTLRFAEVLRTIHFHLFPRTAAMAERFLGQPRGPQTAIDGPALFHWARTEYRVKELSASTLRTAEEIRNALQ